MPYLTINFSSTGDEKIIIELDEDMNDGKTSFLYNSKAYFKVFCDPDIDVTLNQTDGVITTEGTGAEEIIIWPSFLASEKAAFEKPCINIVSQKWLGNDLGKITKNSLWEMECATKPDPTGTNGIGINWLKYNTTFRRYAIKVTQRYENGSRLFPSYPVIVSVFGVSAYK